VPSLLLATPGRIPERGGHLKVAGIVRHVVSDLLEPCAARSFSYDPVSRHQQAEAWTEGYRPCEEMIDLVYEALHRFNTLVLTYVTYMSRDMPEAYAFTE
jgi:hypothetical protein